MGSSKDSVIRNLASALTEALLWSYVEHAEGPTYRVPCAIDGDLWLWTRASNKSEAYKIIKEAVRKAAQVSEPELAKG